MEDIIKSLETIVKNELEKCKAKNKIPSDRTLDIIKMINYFYCL
ncbi:MAG: hypothetical protein RR290_00570 [Clostridia bacterium]